jgi:thiol-disulfide isomerase/thioredoxin
MVQPAIDERAPHRIRGAVALPVAAVLVAVVAAVVVAGTASSGAAPGPVPVRSVVEGPAPTFRLPALGGPGSVSLPPVAQPVILSFFASWCEGCQSEMGTMSRLYASAGGRVRIIGIDVSDTAGAARALLARNHIAYPVGMDRGYRTAAAYRLVGLPTTVYLDGRHQVVGTTVGPLTAPVGEAWLGVLEGSRT